MEDCCNCVSVKKQLEDLKQKHLLDFRTIKQKIISTDKLIRSYHEKCQEHDKQKKYVGELTVKLDSSQRSVEVIKLQLRKSLEQKEPLQKRCNELERGKVLQCNEIQTLQDRLRGSQSLVNQLQVAIKQTEESTNSMKIETTLHSGTIEEYKKSQRKHEDKISKLNEQVLTEKKANKALQKELTKSQKQVKSLFDEAEKSKKLIDDLRKLLKTGEDDNDSATSTTLAKELKTLKDDAVEYKKMIEELNEELRKAKTQSTVENKNSAENKIKSPVTPRRSTRIRKSVTPKQSKASSIIDTEKPFTRLQQKNLVAEIDKNSHEKQAKGNKTLTDLFAQEEHLTSGSDSEEEPSGALMDRIDEMLNIPRCPSLSPLPPSPRVDKCMESVNSDDGFEEDHDDIDDDIDDDSIDAFIDYLGNGICDDNVNESVNLDNGSKNDRDNISDTIGSDNISKDNCENIDHHISKSTIDNRDDNIRKDDKDNIDNTADDDDNLQKSAKVNDIGQTVDDKLDTCPEPGNITIGGDNILKSREDNLNKESATSFVGMKSQDADEHNGVSNSDGIKSTLKENVSGAEEDTVSSPVKKKDDEDELQTSDLIQAKGKKRDLQEATASEYGGKLMTLRSRKKRRSVGSVITVGMFAEKGELQSECNPFADGTSRTLRRSKSVNLDQELGETGDEMSVRITRSRSLEIGKQTEGILEVKPRQKRRRRISSNDGEEELESSTLESDAEKESNNESGKTKKGVTSQGSPDRPQRRGNLSIDEEQPVKESDNKGSSALNAEKAFESCMEECSSENHENTKKSGVCPRSSERPPSGSNGVLEKREKATVPSVRTTANQNNLETCTQDQKMIIETTKRPQTRSIDGLLRQNVVSDGVDSVDGLDVSTMESQSNDIANQHQATPQKPPTRCTRELCEQDVAIDDGTDSMMGGKFSMMENQTDSKTVTQREERFTESPQRPKTRSMGKLPEQVLTTNIADNKDEKCGTSKISTKENKTDSLSQHQDTSVKTTRKSRRWSVGGLPDQDYILTRTALDKDAKLGKIKVSTTENNSSNESLMQFAITENLDCLFSPTTGENKQSEFSVKVNETSVKALTQDKDELIQTPRRPRTRSMGQLPQQNLVSETAEIKEFEASRSKIHNGGENSFINESSEPNLIRMNDARDKKDVYTIEGDIHASFQEHRHTTVDNELLEANKVATKSLAVDTLSISSFENIDSDSSIGGQHHCIQNHVKGCLNAVIDSVVNSDNLTTFHKEIDSTKPVGTISTVVDKNNEGSSLFKRETNAINDNREKSSKCDEMVEETGKKSVTIANMETPGLRPTDKNEIDTSLGPLDWTWTGIRRRTRKAHMRKTAVAVNASLVSDSSCNSTVSRDEHTKTEETKQNVGTLDSIVRNNEDVRAATSKEDPEVDTKFSGNEKISRAHKRKNEAKDGSDVFSKSERDEICSVDSSDIDKPSLDGSEFGKPSDHKSVTSATQTRSRTSKRTLSDSDYHSKEGIVTVGSTTLDGLSKSEESIRKQDGPASPQESIQFGQVFAPLSPIPRTPKRPPRPAKIPCFESLDCLVPLSPIPASPPYFSQADEVEDVAVNDPLSGNIELQELPDDDSVYSTKDDQVVRGESMFSDLTFDELLEQSPRERLVVRKQQNTGRDDLDCPLNRYPNVSELKYTNFMFTKLKNNEITTGDFVKAFSQRRNVKKHPPIISGLTEVLRVTQDDVEHALKERYAEYGSCSDGSGEPVLSEFEMKAIVAVDRLCKLPRLSKLVSFLAKCLQRELCGLFKSGENDAGLLAMCRVLTALCRLTGEGSHVRLFCYDILKQDQRQSLTERIIIAVAFVWPAVLGKGCEPLSITSGAVTISGPPHQPFLATLQVILMSRDMSSELTSQWLQQLCGWCDIPRGNDVLEWLARDLVRVLRDTSHVKSKECNPMMAFETSVQFEVIKTLELISVILGWKWTNNVLIREILWPLFAEWKMKGCGKTKGDMSSNQAKNDNGCVLTAVGQSPTDSIPPYCLSKMSTTVGLQSDETSKHHVCSSNIHTDLCTAIENISKGGVESDGNHGSSMEATIVNVLCLFGRLGCERLKKGEMINLDAIINLMCAIVSCYDDEKVSFNIANASAKALLDIVKADPFRIPPVLDIWCLKSRKIDDKMASQFAQRMKDVRKQMWST